METNEKRFERDIETYLINEGGYEQFVGQAPDGVWLHNRALDLSKCIYMDVLCEFIEKTQPKEWARYTKFYGAQAKDKLYIRLENTINEQGLIHVLRNGIVDMGVSLKVCYFKPESELNTLLWERYNRNILGCTRQFHYSTANNNSIDMVLSVNGIPVVALELKNQLTGQSYQNAITQYKNDRDPKEFAFKFDHRFLVYFAADLSEVWMTTKLDGSKTRFMPFNQGSMGGGMPGHKGNPQNTNDYDTAYLWKEVLNRDALLDIIHRFISRVDKKETVITKNGGEKKVTNSSIIFPRFHQYDVVNKLLEDVRENGVGTNYLIQHSAGSGKSNSIAWITYRLASMHDEDNNSVFNSVIVVTNRVVLDSQLQDTIKSFDHTPGLVEAIDESKHSRNLAEAINDGKRIIICTIQKFLFAYKDMQRFKGRKFAIIIDEAHQGQSGESARTLRRSLIDIEKAVQEYAETYDVDPEEVDVNDVFINTLLGQGQHDNQSFFAFTATPKLQTLEQFGTRDAYTGQFAPFHVYSMQQAIEEGFILDVLQNYTTVKEAFELVRKSQDNPEIFKGPATKALYKYYKESEITIGQKTEMIMENFLNNGRYAINGKGKAMVVADSRKSAVKYYLAISEYIKNHPNECAGTRVCIAFSGEVRLSEYPDQVFTEVSMNRDENGKYITTDKKFRAAFHSDLFNIMVVANKYQTGFDEPLLHSMYVDKKLRDVAAVQTLSRLNRTAYGKDSTFVMDFVNTAEDIKKAFTPYYEVTLLAKETDLNKIYDLHAKIAEKSLYSFEEVHNFNEFMKQHKDKAQDSTALGRLTGILSPIVARYNSLEDDERYFARDFIRRFIGAYKYVTSLVQLNDIELFEEYQFCMYIIKLLPGPGKVDLHEILKKVKLEQTDLQTTFNGRIILNEKPDPRQLIIPIKPRVQNKTKDSLQNIINALNEMFANFSDGDRTIVTTIYNMFQEDADFKKYKKYAEDNDQEMFVKSLFPEKFAQIVAKCLAETTDTFDKLFTDEEFNKKVQDEMAKELYRSLRRKD